MNVQRWPLDYETLKRGDTIPGPQIEAATGVSIDRLDKFNLARLDLKSRVEKELRRLHGTAIMLRIDGDGLRILTDQEQTEYAARRFGQELDGMLRMHRFQQGVDQSELTEEERILHERRLYTQGVLLQGINNARKQLRIEAHKRSTPGLPEPEKE